MNEMEQVLREVQSNPAIRSAVIISGKPGCFIAGADIGMLEKLQTKEEVTAISRSGQKILDNIANSKKPIVAAIMGSCLGGGLEVALACHYRIAVTDKKTGLGLPEVMLGLLPGAGGTQRLPKLTSLPNALDMVLTGKTIKADRAKKMGIVDLLVNPLGPGLDTPLSNTMKYLEDTAVLAAKEIVSGKIKIDRTKKGLIDSLMEMVMQNTFVLNQIFGRARAQVMKMSGGLYPAPLKVNKPT